MTARLWYLIEDFDTKFSLNVNGGNILALAPEVCYQLDRIGIKYNILEDFFCGEDLKKNSKAYFYEQLEWFRKFDSFLENNIEYCAQNKINLATAHYNQFKYFIDSVIAYTYILTSFIEKNRPERIIYVTSHPKNEESYSIYDLFNSQESILALLLPHLSKSFKIPLELDILKQKGEAASRNNARQLWGSARKIFTNSHLKSLLNFIRFKKYSRIFSRHKGENNSKILFLHAGCQSIDYVIIKAIQAGARVFTMSKEAILKENGLFQKKVLDFNEKSLTDFTQRLKNECEKASEHIVKQNDLFAWINAKCPIDISEIISPYLKHFVSSICFSDIMRIDKLVECYDRQKIDMVMVRSSSGHDSAFSLSAAGKGTKKVCLQHSCTARDNLSLQMTELSFFDYYVAAESLSEKYFNTCDARNIFNKCTVLQSPHYLNSLQKTYKRKANLKKGEKETIIFVPADGIPGTYNFNNEYYTGIWYFKFLIGLADYFAKRTDKIFIFKYPRSSKWMADSVIPYIKDKGYGNIFIEDKPLVRCFGLGHRIIHDYPSTGLFESAAIGMPVISLYKSNITIWDESLKVFGKSLQKFSNTQEAIAIIDKFLNEDEEGYIVKLPMREIKIEKLLESIESGKN